MSVKDCENDRGVLSPRWQSFKSFFDFSTTWRQQKQSSSFDIATESSLKVDGLLIFPSVAFAVTFRQGLAPRGFGLVLKAARQVTFSGGIYTFQTAG